MLLIRRFEEKVEERFRAGELPGFLHVAIGQEAIATGVCAALAGEDVIASTHRAHGHTIAKGTPVEQIMAELYGKVEGCSGGYGGSMHLYDLEVGNLGRERRRWRRPTRDRRGCARLSDARREARRGRLLRRRRDEHGHLPRVAQPRAAVEGSRDLRPREQRLGGVDAGSQQLPLPVDQLGKRAAAYGMKLIEADGQDVEAVYLAALAARDHALAGKGPVLLHLRTYRLTGHYIGDPQVYRDRDALNEERETKDPDSAPRREARTVGRRVRGRSTPR